jgi:hypothetical protein
VGHFLHPNAQRHTVVALSVKQIGRAIGRVTCAHDSIQRYNHIEAKTMPEFIVFMHSDVVDRDMANDGSRWELYLAKLKTAGHFNGGSAIGRGLRFKKGTQTEPAGLGIEGFMRVEARNLDEAQIVLEGNPNYEAGGALEVRELLQDE